MHVHARTCARMCAYDLHAGMSLELVPLSAAARVEQHSLRHVAVRHPLLQLLPPSKILPHTGCHHTGMPCIVTAYRVMTYIVMAYVVIVLAYLVIGGWRIGSTVDATHAYCSMLLPTVASGL